MEVKKKKNFKFDYKKLAIFIIIMVVLIVSVVLIAMYVSRNKTLNFDNFEKIAIYSYLEDDLLDVDTLYKISGKSNYNELSEVNSIDYSDKKAIVQSIEKTSDDRYKVIFKIVNSMVIDNPSTEATGEVILSIQRDELNIDSCTIND